MGEDRPLEQTLDDTAWIVISMTGFPPDNVVSSERGRRPSMKFYRSGGLSWASGSDGCNGRPYAVHWTEAGFTPFDSSEHGIIGMRTDKGCTDHQPNYMLSLFEEDRPVTVELPGEDQLILRSGDLEVTAVPFQPELHAGATIRAEH